MISSDVKPQVFPRPSTPASQSSEIILECASKCLSKRESKLAFLKEYHWHLSHSDNISLSDLSAFKNLVKELKAAFPEGYARLVELLSNVPVHSSLELRTKWTTKAMSRSQKVVYEEHEGAVLAGLFEGHGIDAEFFSGMVKHAFQKLFFSLINEKEDVTAVFEEITKNTDAAIYDMIKRFPDSHGGVTGTVIYLDKKGWLYTATLGNRTGVMLYRMIPQRQFDLFKVLISTCRGWRSPKERERGALCLSLQGASKKSVDQFRSHLHMPANPEWIAKKPLSEQEVAKQIESDLEKHKGLKQSRALGFFEYRHFKGTASAIYPKWKITKVRVLPSDYLLVANRVFLSGIEGCDLQILEKSGDFKEVGKAFLKKAETLEKAAYMLLKVKVKA